MLSVIESKIRVLAITSPFRGAGVSTLAQGLTTAFNRAGRKTLLIDASAPLAAYDGASGWTPGEPPAPSSIKAGDAGLLTLNANVTATSRPRFSNVERVKSALEKDFSDYAHIILDLAPVDNSPSEGLNPVAAARAADGVVLVALTGLTYRAELTSAAQSLRQVGANVTGVVLNDQFCATLGEEIADVAYTRLGRWLPRTAQWVARKATSVPYFSQNFRIVR